MTAFHELQRAVQQDVPDAPGPFVFTSLARVGREICDKTHVWRDDPVTLDLTDGTGEFSITIPTGSDIVAVEYLNVDGLPIYPSTERKIEDCDPRWRETTGDPRAFITLMQEKKIRLYPIPNRTVTDGIEYRITLKPTINARTLPEFLCEQYDDVIRNGVLYELLSMPNRPWSNMQQALAYRRIYHQKMYDLRGKILERHAAVNHAVVTRSIA